MGTWLATIRFPDGTERYARYSTVVECIVSSLYAEVCRDGETLPGGDLCYRDEVAGEPLPASPEAPPAPMDELLLVSVEEQANNSEWHALYCPSRSILLGPAGGFHRYELQENFDLIRDDDGVRHLCEGAGPDTECGRRLAGEPLGLYFPSLGPGASGDEPDPPPAPDLFAEWDAPDFCRLCLFTWLTKPAPVYAPVRTSDPEPEPAPGWWARLSRAWREGTRRW